MNSSTGEIGRFDTIEEARRKGFDVPLTEHEATVLAATPAQQRFEALRQLRNPDNPRRR